MRFEPAVAATGTTSIARVITGAISDEMGGGGEYLENAVIDCTVTHDAILCMLLHPVDWAERQGVTEP